MWLSHFKDVIFLINKLKLFTGAQGPPGQKGSTGDVGAPGTAG